MKKIPTVVWVGGAVAVLWYLSRPKGAAQQVATGTTAAQAGAQSIGGTTQAGAMPHGGGGGHGGGGHHHGGHAHFRGGPGWGVFGEWGPYYYGTVPCDPRLTCAQQPVLPCACG